VVLASAGMTVSPDVPGPLPATGDLQGFGKIYVYDAKTGREVAALPKLAGTRIHAVPILVRALRTVPWGRGCGGWKRFALPGEASMRRSRSKVAHGAP
jgi:hypothetical protein